MQICGATFCFKAFSVCFRIRILLVVINKAWAPQISLTSAAPFICILALCRYCLECVHMHQYTEAKQIAVIELALSWGVMPEVDSVS